MKFVLYTVCISPHQLPLMRLIVASLGENQCRYIYTEKLENGRKKLGWKEEKEPWLVYERDYPELCHDALNNCTVLMSGIRDFDLFEYREAEGKITIYSSERWFKPVLWHLAKYFGEISIPGWIKLLHPTYLKMVFRFRRLLIRDDYNGFYYFPISMNAARDAISICGEMHSVDFQRRAGGWVNCNITTSWKNKICLWGYFVNASEVQVNVLKELRQKQRQDVHDGKRPLHILWVGRMLALKNVDIIIQAVRFIKRNSRKPFEVFLTLVGNGPEEERLKKLSHGLPVEFRQFVPISQVREIMREHDLYVFASNSFDGWGAVVSEALEERMPVLASRQSGVGSTVLPEECLFDCNNANELASRILAFDTLPQVDGSQWSVKAAANFLIENFLK